MCLQGTPCATALSERVLGHASEQLQSGPRKRYSGAGAQVITASSDGTVRVWDSKTADCVTAFRPPQATPSGEVGVLAVAPHPGNVDHVVVCTRSPTVYLMTLQGQARLALCRGVGLRIP